MSQKGQALCQDLMSHVHPMLLQYRMNGLDGSETAPAGDTLTRFRRRRAARPLAHKTIINCLIVHFNSLEAGCRSERLEPASIRDNIARSVFTTRSTTRTRRRRLLTRRVSSRLCSQELITFSFDVNTRLRNDTSTLGAERKIKQLIKAAGGGRKFKFDASRRKSKLEMDRLSLKVSDGFVTQSQAHT
ncbi:hypothetical protein EVAR_76232_1 [Eumeta japonica]|uniref:Uncharacterized protein n=1 Tax=Eumeta variegata TaxID=151549 RepID=A0A4C1UNX1_EUMVA|nr:hypothetical protein EVAR_76232_1 [Eumeta japonica]